MVVSLCSEIFSGQTHTPIDWKFHSESFAVWVCPLNISQKDSYMQFSVLYYACISRRQRSTAAHNSETANISARTVHRTRIQPRQHIIDRCWGQGLRARAMHAQSCGVTTTSAVATYVRRLAIYVRVAREDRGSRLGRTGDVYPWHPAA